MSTDNLTWDDLAELYKYRTGQLARIRPLDEVYQWALTQPDIQQNQDTSLRLVGTQKIVDEKQEQEFDQYYLGVDAQFGDN